MTRRIRARTSVPLPPGSAIISSRILVQTACRPKARDAQVLLLVNERAAEARCLLDARQRAPVGSRVSTHPPVVPSNGRAPEVERRGPRPSATAKVARDVVTAAQVQIPSPPSRPAHGPLTAARPRASAAARCPLG